MTWIGDQLGTGLPTHTIVEKGHPVLWMSGNVVIEIKDSGQRLLATHATPQTHTYTVACLQV